MLSKLAVKRFRERELNDFRYLKRLTRSTLMQMMNDLDPVPDFISKKPMWKHQLVALLAGIYLGHFLFFLDMGLGKTRVILEMIAYLKKKGELKSALVVVLNDSAIETWVMEVEEHRPDLKCIPMYGNTKQRLQMLEEEADLFVINYQGLNYMCSELVHIGNKKGRKLIMKPARLKRVTSRFNLMCLDETTEIMSHTSLTFRVCRKISEFYKHRFGMSGIPVGRDPHVLWSQFNYCDHGDTLGGTLAVFRQALFKKKVNYWSGYYDYKFDKKKTKVLNRMMQNSSISYDESECRDMPKKVYKPIYVPFTDDMRSYYNNIVDKLKTDRHDLRLVRNSFLHMRQIASGFIGLVDDETGDKIQIEFPENPKIEAMSQIVREIPKDRKFLIFHEYRWTGARISKELDKLGVSHSRLYGGQKDGPGVLRRFIEQDDITGLVASNGCGAFSLNLQIANYEIFVESPVSPIVRAQAEKRIHRGSQKKRCFFMDLIMRKNSADESIQEFLKEGKDLRQALMRGSVNLKLKRV